jgi:hypothetical protein
VPAEIRSAKNRRIFYKAPGRSNFARLFHVKNRIKSVFYGTFPENAGVG